MTELKPCPFCGGEAELNERLMHDAARTWIEYSIRCMVCNVYVPVFGGCTDKASAITQWQSRWPDWSDEVRVRRRHLLTLQIGADHIDAVIGLFRNLTYRLTSHQMSPHGISGGYDSGYEWLYDEDPSITHDSYVARLNEVLEAQDAQPTLP